MRTSKMHSKRNEPKPTPNSRILLIFFLLILIAFIMLPWVSSPVALIPLFFRFLLYLLDNFEWFNFHSNDLNEIVSNFGYRGEEIEMCKKGFQFVVVE